MIYKVDYSLQGYPDVVKGFLKLFLLYHHKCHREKKYFCFWNCLACFPKMNAIIYMKIYV